MTVRRLAASSIAAPSVAERDWDSLQFRTIFALSFTIYLVIAVAKRLSPTYWRDDSPLRQSILADARAGAGTTAQMAFAG